MTSAANIMKGQVLSGSPDAHSGGLLPGKYVRLSSWQGRAQVLLKTPLAELSCPVFQVCVKLSWTLWPNLSVS